MPLSTMPSAARRTTPASTAAPWTFQLFHPIGGVSARRSPTHSSRVVTSAPATFSAVISTATVPASAGAVPRMIPLAGSSVSEVGSPDAVNRSGRIPVAATVWTSSVAGRQPTRAAPWKRGGPASSTGDATAGGAERPRGDIGSV